MKKTNGLWILLLSPLLSQTALADAWPRFHAACQEAVVSAIFREAESNYVNLSDFDGPTYRGGRSVGADLFRVQVSFVFTDSDEDYASFYQFAVTVRNRESKHCAIESLRLVKQEEF